MDFDLCICDRRVINNKVCCYCIGQYTMDEEMCTRCNTYIGYQKCYQCHISKNIICLKCVHLFIKPTLYTICVNPKCVAIHKILHQVFSNDIAKHIINYY